MDSMSLSGEWSLYQEGSDEPIPANVPGCVHTDLLAAERIEDPYYRDNELNLFWIGETDWTYRRSFSVQSDFLANQRLRLHCMGLDTLATIKLNGVELGRTDNMFRVWDFDVKSLLVDGENELVVHFDAPVPYVRRRGEERQLPAWGVGDHKLDGGGWIRKEPCNFGWDWGPMLATCGIWREIELLGFDNARIDELLIRQRHGDSGFVDLEFSLKVECAAPADLSAAVTVTLDGHTVVSKEVKVSESDAHFQLSIEDPKLWWPKGMGAQPLYRVNVDLHNDRGELVDRLQRRVGLRTLRLIRSDDEWGESFHFEANGVPFFAKGANWIPADTFATRLVYDDYARLLQDTVDANMNMLRVWGGGIYEDDAFYDLCDELGICVWQDFIFACATYPSFDQAFMANVKAEAEDNVRRIRHHACLALWCGNNELEQGLVSDEWTDYSMSWSDYAELFDRLLADVVGRLDPDRDYWPCSPHSPRGDRHDFNNPDWGDAHLWSVWHGKQPFEWYRTCTHRFNSEFGFQSFPEPETVYTYTEPEDRNITSFVMEHHQRSGIGNSTIIHYMLDWFRLPSSFEDVLWLSQILQGMAIKYAVEHWRRGMPRGMGTLYWQLNDCWQVASWSSVDYFGNWKALHYMAKAFYAPLLVSGLEDWETGVVEVHVTSDLLQEKVGRVNWLLTDVDGEELSNASLPVEIGANGDTLATTLELGAHLAEHGARALMLWLELIIDGETVSTNFVSFARPKHLELKRPNIDVAVKPLDNNRFQIQLSSDRPALWAWITVDGATPRASDNFFHLIPGKRLSVEITPKRPMDSAELAESIQVRSLVDTYRTPK